MLQQVAGYRKKLPGGSQLGNLSHSSLTIIKVNIQFSLNGVLATSLKYGVNTGNSSGSNKYTMLYHLGKIYDIAQYQ